MAVSEAVAGAQETEGGVGVTTSMEDTLGDATWYTAVLPRRRQSTMSRRTHPDVCVDRGRSVCTRACPR